MKMKKLSLRKNKFTAYVLFVFMVLFFSGCATVSTTQGPSTQEEYVLKDLCVRYNISCTVDSVSQVITIKQKGASARAIVGSEAVVIDQKKVYLSKPVTISHGTVYVPHDFKTKVIQALFAKEPGTLKFQRIIIDAGHGGKDPGGTGYAGTEEKDIVLDIARRLKAELNREGFDAVTTRSDDRFLTLEERVDIAHKEGADLFISVHANIAKDHKVDGLEVYYPKPLTYETKNEVYRPDRYKEFFCRYRMKRNDSNLETILIDMLYAQKLLESYRLSDYIADQVARDVHISDRGSKSAGFYVLKHTLIPSILVEVGFLSNAQEEKKLKSSDYRQDLAASLARRIKQYATYY